MFYLIFVFIGAIFLSWFFLIFLRKKDEDLDLSMLPYVEINGDTVLVKNIRNFKYKTLEDYEEHYYDKAFSLRDIRKMYYIVEPFSKIRGVAHTFLSFEFKNDKFLAVSIEVPKKKGENFSLFKSFFKYYKIVYIVGDERDLILRRSNHENNPVYVYPVNLSREKVEDIFMDIIERINKMKKYPEVYNVFTNTCTTNIFDHVNKIFHENIPIGINVLLPRNSAWLLYKLGLIDTKLSYEEIKEESLINEKADIYAESSNFSVKIRQK